MCWALTTHLKSYFLHDITSMLGNFLVVWRKPCQCFQFPEEFPEVCLFSRGCCLVQADSLSCTFFTGPSLLYGKSRVKQMICKVSQCYRVIARNPFTSFQLPFSVLPGDTELSILLQLQLLLSAPHPISSFSSHPANGIVLSPAWPRMAVLNCCSSELLLFQSPRFCGSLFVLCRAA